MNTNIGSLSLVRKRPLEYGDDSTTTIAGKRAAMAGGINLRAPVRSMRRHDYWRTRVVVLLVAACVVVGMFAHWAWRML